MRVCPDCNGFGTVTDEDLFCDYCDGTGQVGEGYSN